MQTVSGMFWTCKVKDKSIKNQTLGLTLSFNFSVNHFSSSGRFVIKLTLTIE